MPSDSTKVSNKDLREIGVIVFEATSCRKSDSTNRLRLEEKEIQIVSLNNSVTSLDSIGSIQNTAISRKDSLIESSSHIIDQQEKQEKKLKRQRNVMVLIAAVIIIIGLL